ncbi:hypothetical protein LEP1GSC039_3569 [Leptospira santarosai str. 2000027870]|nr:hypothetical protein LEP1GSC039_3569 [Leptospira santarosai str. 2000027870]
MPSLKERLDIALLEKHKAWHEARGMLSPSKMLTTISPNQTNHLQSVGMMDPNNTRFNAEMVLSLKEYIDDLQKNVETMFAQFSNKTEEIKEEYAQNQEIESYQKKLYEASKKYYLAAFQVLPGDLGKSYNFV